MFQGFPEIKEALISGRMQAGFLVAPLAIALRSQGVPIHVVALGHRYGSAVVVRKDGPIHSVRDLKGKTIAIPSRFSDERLIVLRALEQNGLRWEDVKMVEMAPADVTSALVAKAVDAFSMGEPFPSQAEMLGVGRVLFKAQDYWPDYMSCILVVRDDVIESRPHQVQALVDGMIKSGLWLDKGAAERKYAARFVGQFYYHQSPELLDWALLHPLSRVQFSPLQPARKDFDLVQSLMIKDHLIPRPVPFDDLVDMRFADRARAQEAWDFGPAEGKEDGEGMEAAQP